MGGLAQVRRVLKHTEEKDFLPNMIGFRWVGAWEWGDCTPTPRSLFGQASAKSQHVLPSILELLKEGQSSSWSKPLAAVLMRSDTTVWMRCSNLPVARVQTLTDLRFAAPGTIPEHLTITCPQGEGLTHLKRTRMTMRQPRKLRKPLLRVFKAWSRTSAPNHPRHTLQHLTHGSSAWESPSPWPSGTQG